MPQARGHRFTIYDALEAAGHFDANPANAFARSQVDGSSLYEGPVQYPKMLYHPEGEEEVIVAGEEIISPLRGPMLVGEQRAIIHKIVNNKKEDQEAAVEGWHDHPAKAIRVRVELFIQANEHLSEKEKTKLLAKIPIISSTDRIKHLEAELARLTSQLEGEQGDVENEKEALSSKTPAGVKLSNGLTIQPPPT